MCAKEAVFCQVGRVANTGHRLWAAGRGPPVMLVACRQAGRQAHRQACTQTDRQAKHMRTGMLRVSWAGGRQSDLPFS
jgi:hypothetical protein